MMKSSDRGSFGSKMGVILASAGSAVGLGNIWRFPMEVGKNGGAAFILIYLCCVFMLAMPIMLSEFVIGRSSKANAVGAFRILTHKKSWIITGFIGILGGLLVLSYYSVVAGWTLHYSISSWSGALIGAQNYEGIFQQFVTSPWRPLVFQYIFLLLTFIIVARGIETGIERFSKIMMPLLLFLLLLLSFLSLTLPGAEEGIRFLLKPDFSKVTTPVVLSAMGQAFFSLSVGIGCLATYASYFKPETRLVHAGVSVCLIDSLVAIMSGFIIFPAVFSVEGIEANAGPGLVYITLPNVFNMVFKDLPSLGFIFSGLFYVLLLLAALTSTISMHEIATAFIRENYQISRQKAALVVTIVCLVLGTICCLSFGMWNHIRIAEMNFFELFDFITAKLLMPLGGMLITLFVGWSLDKERVINELTNNHSLKITYLPYLLFLIRWVAPVGVMAIFMNELFH